MLGHYRVLLEGVVANPDARLGELPLLTEAERHQLLIEWNQTETDYPRDKCIHQLFEEQVERTPDAIAVVFEDRQLTYRELNERSNQLARYLRKQGVGPESLVVLCMERSSESIIVLLAILKSGGSYVALDTNMPSKRMLRILEDARPTVIVVQSKMQKATIESAKSEGVALAIVSNVICLDQCVEVIARERTETLSLHITSENQAYVCFTSGSSGLPKGVSIPHRAVVRLVKNTNYVCLSATDVVLQLATMSFDASTFEIWGCLLNGSRLIVFPSKMLSLAQIGFAIRNYRVSVLFLTTGLFNQMVDYELNSLECVRQVLTGGDVSSKAHVRRAFERLGEGRLIHAYGPTENTTFTCCFPITNCSFEGHSIPIGRPISNTQCYILDRDLLPVPIGVRGELFAGGDGLARGYLNDPKLTAEKFIANPLRPVSLLYRTGDFARYRSDGSIEFLGRIDHQVKMRGFRVELGEIETVLKLHPSVREAVVVAREDAPGGRQLVAYVAPASATAPAGELREFLKERLPSYMVPSAFVFIDVFPLTPNGKLDRKALPAPEGRSQEPDQSYVAPRTPTEEALARIWCEVLGLRQVGIHDNFFELGGHSLIAIRAISEIGRVLKANVTAADLFLNPTVQRLTKVIAEKQPMERRGHRVITLREGNAGPAVYFIFANFHEFRLAQLFSEERPVFGIEVPWPTVWLKAAVENQMSTLPKMEELVAPYVAALHAHAGASPCILAGFCQGGYMAFEAAQQFKRQGGNVEMVFLFDVAANAKVSLASIALLRLRQIQRQAPNWRAAPFSKVVGYYARTLWIKSLRRVAKAVSELRSMPVYSLDERAPFIDEQGATIPWQAWIRWSKTCLNSYSPRCLDSQGALVRSLDLQDLHPKYSSLFWQDRFAREMEVIDVPEGHLSIARDAQNALALKRKVGDLLTRRYANHIGGS
jgi:aspartate racemase